mmetsp:Transcript_5423/g.13643  ORF Transcript_5423/g.13643 Transcript_5423/m.13643 type:complete len:209 (-) Transcript_5423:137-763(-)
MDGRKAILCEHRCGEASVAQHHQRVGIAVQCCKMHRCGTDQRQSIDHGGVGRRTDSGACTRRACIVLVRTLLLGNNATPFEHTATGGEQLAGRWEFLVGLLREFSQLFVCLEQQTHGFAVAVAGGHMQWSQPRVVGAGEQGAQSLGRESTCMCKKGSQHRCMTVDGSPVSCGHREAVAGQQTIFERQLVHWGCSRRRGIGSPLRLLSP